MNWTSYIENNNKVLLGKPVVKGTRISVEHILNLLASGWTDTQILENYPRLKREHLQAVFAYLQDCMKDGLLHLQPLKSA